MQSFRQVEHRILIDVDALRESSLGQEIERQQHPAPSVTSARKEIKRADAPTMTSSMVSAFKDLELHRLLVVYPGSTRYTLRPKVEVMSLAQCVAELV